VNDLGLGNGDTGLRRQRHGRMLDERSVNVFVVEELDDPLLAIDFNQCLGLCAAQGAATPFNDFGFESSQRIPSFNLGDNLAEFLGLRQPWQGTAFSRDVGGG